MSALDLVMSTSSRVDFNSDSRQLESFRTHDFVDAMGGGDTGRTSELTKLFAKPGVLADAIRYVPFVDYVCRALARQYVLPPERSLSAGSTAQIAKLEEVYSASSMDAFLGQVQQRAIGQNAVVIALDPYQPRRPGVGSSSRVVPHSWISADVQVTGDPMLSDLRDADEVRLRVPISRTHTDTVVQITYGERVYTRTEAYVQDYYGEKREIPGFPGGVNPLKYIPLVGVQLVSPAVGHWLPPLPLDLDSVQIGLILAISDCEHMCRLRSAGREVLTGGQADEAAKKFRGGPEAIWAIASNDTEYQAVSFDVRIDRYLSAIETQVKLLGTYRHLNTEGLWTSTGITGAAKEIEREPEVYDRLRQEQIWRDVEQALVEVLVDMGRLGPRALDIRGPRVQVDYRYPEIQENHLQGAQRDALNCALGLDNPEDIICRRARVPMSVAIKRVEKNLARWTELLKSWRGPSGAITPPPGIDSIASQVLVESNPQSPSREAAA